MMSRLNECCRDTRTKCKKFLSAGAYADSKLLLDFDFTDGIVFGGVHLIPETLQTGQRAERIPYSPVLVVQAKDRIINGHMGSPIQAPDDQRSAVLSPAPFAATCAELSSAL